MPREYFIPKHWSGVVVRSDGTFYYHDWSLPGVLGSGLMSITPDYEPEEYTKVSESEVLSFLRTQGKENYIYAITGLRDGEFRVKNLPAPKRFLLKYRKPNGQISSYSVSNPITEDSKSVTTYAFGRGIRAFKKSQIVQVQEVKAKVKKS